MLQCNIPRCYFRPSRGKLNEQEPEAERKGIIIASHLPDAPLHIAAAPERMMQVITNLMTNAINHTPEGGQTRISVTVEPEDGVAIEVRDSGISDEHLPYIFQPFYRVGQKGGGTGLGLSITREIVERHGGTISVASEPGHGSIFTVRLKLEQVGTSV